MVSDDRRALWQGYGDALTQGIELAAVPLVFAVAGLALDRWLGTAPLLAVALTVFALVGSFLRSWYHYDARMSRLDEDQPWGRRPPTSDPGDAR